MFDAGRNLGQCRSAPPEWAERRPARQTPDQSCARSCVPSSLTDPAGCRSCPEAVVDIHHSYPRCTRVEHTKQRCETTERGSVPNTRRYCDDRHTDHAAHDTGQCPFHPCHHYQDSSTLNLLCG